MNNTLRARKPSIELLEPRTLFSTITVASVDVTPGIAPTQAVFTATLNTPATTPIKLSYSTLNGSAKAGVDYRQTASHVVIPAGSTSATFAVEVLPSTATEPDRQFYLKLSTGSGNTLVPTEVSATIVENSTLPTVNVSDATIGIGLHHVQISTFYVGLSNRSAEPITVDYTTHGVTALAGVNFDAVTSALVIPVYHTGGKIKIKVIGDAIVSPDKVFDIDITGATNASVPPGLFSRVVVEDDSATSAVRPTLTVSTPAVVRGNAMNFVLTLSAASASDVSVRYFTSPVTASTSQYTSESGIVTIPAGQTTATITVPTTQGTTVNTDTQLRLVLSAPANAQIAQTNILGTILAYPTIVVSDAASEEADVSPVKPLTFYVTLNAPSPLPVTVTYNTANGNGVLNDQDESASAGIEYTATSGTLTFAPGQTSLPITVPVLSDLTAGSTELLSVNLSSPVDGIIGRGTGIGTISDLGEAVGVPTVAVTAPATATTVQNGQFGIVDFTVSLSNTSAVPVTVAYTTAPSTLTNTGTSGVDFSPEGGTLTFEPGQQSLNLPVTVNGASTTAGTVAKTFFLELSAPVNATLAVGGATATGTVDEVG